MTRTALYRHFDAGGELLYVGISVNPTRRTSQHKDRGWWFKSIARITVEWHDSRAAALAAEALAIRRERPANNVLRPKIARGGLSYAVRHIGTGRLNGWYTRASDALGMLGWMRSVFPGERFEIVEPDVGGLNFITRSRELKPMDWELWTKSPPNYAAGDEFEKRMAA